MIINGSNNNGVINGSTQHVNGTEHLANSTVIEYHDMDNLDNNASPIFNSQEDAQNPRASFDTEDESEDESVISNQALRLPQ